MVRQAITQLHGMPVSHLRNGMNKTHLRAARLEDGNETRNLSCSKSRGKYTPLSTMDLAIHRCDAVPEHCVEDVYGISGFRIVIAAGVEDVMQRFGVSDEQVLALLKREISRQCQN